ncbi:MAG: hypothetical protein R3229_17800 [Alphaproteobacteria bacterium]|nr:hypothetical protein [Alphaproteobacteria bacterium]
MRRVVLMAVGIAVLSSLPWFETNAACPTTHIVGLWERDNGAARLRFFSNNKMHCRLCDPKYPDRCRPVIDPNDPQGRKQCPFRHPDGKVTTLSGWTARDGMLDKLAFADGTSIAVGERCLIDGETGTMKIDGLGTFVCDYEYHCRKLERLPPAK